jgi:hypothetical protein
MTFFSLSGCIEKKIIEPFFEGLSYLRNYFWTDLSRISQSKKTTCFQIVIDTPWIHPITRKAKSRNFSLNFCPKVELIVFSISACPFMTESRFCIFYFPYLNRTKSDKAGIFSIYLSRISLHILKVSLDLKLPLQFHDWNI